MAARRRRRTPAQTARLALILALNALAAFALWKVWPQRAAAVEAHARVEAPAPAAAPAPYVPSLPPPLAHAEHTELESDLRAIVAEYVEKARKLSNNRVHSGNAAIAIHVRELGSKAEIALGSDRSLRPASNLKLVTTAAALALLGPHWEFETRFEARGPIANDALQGDLVVRGAGDPLYERGGNGDVENLFLPALDELVARGVRSIQGDVVLDEGDFVVPGPGPEWPDASQHWTEYCALAGAFSANRGCLTAVVTPARPGEHARVEVFPRDHGLAENVGVRTEAKGKTNVQLGANPGGLIVRGTIPSGSAPFVDSFAHPDPVELFGNALCGAIARRGILIQGRLRRERHAPPGEVVATLRSPLARYLAAINTDSTNAVADQVFLATARAMIGEGTREAGQRATQLALRRLGVPTEGFVQVDGSGLSRSDLVSAHQIVALIESVLMRDEESAKLYRDSLAVAGETGTLADRMRDSSAKGRVRAKTGYIGGTSALSGIAYALDGRQFVFSCLVNYPDVDGLNTNCWKRMQDAICARLVEAQP